MIPKRMVSVAVETAKGRPMSLAARLELAEQLLADGASDEQAREFIETGLFTAELIGPQVQSFYITGIGEDDDASP